MIPAKEAAALFEQIIGWPYESPGVTDDRGETLGIDCSGAWVRVYKKYGLGGSIEHGSNAQFRRYCVRTWEVTSAAQLKVGDAVFKCRDWREEDRGHRDYGKAPGNLYHVGCVTRVNPLRIVHATPPNAKADTSIGNGKTAWKYAGELSKVEYRGQEPVPVSGTAVVATESGALNIRQQPSTSAGRVGSAPKGAIVDVLKDGDGWALILYGGVTGWVSKDYLRITWADGSGGEQGAGTGSDADDPGVWIPCGTADEAHAIVAVLDLLAGLSSGAMVKGE